MKALTLHQPWASLIAAGVKTIETRSWATKRRGRIAIHAGADAGSLREIHRSAGMLSRHSVAMENHVVSLFGTDWSTIPLGAIVATADLVDCVPMVHTTQPRNGHCLVVGPPPLHRLTLHGRPVDPGTDVTDQLPFGYFEPGRWAWLLAGVRPVTEACPVCARGRVCLAPNCAETCTLERGHINVTTCPVCDGAGECDPIPVRGLQGLWNWEWRP